MGSPDADRLAENLRHEMFEHIPALAVANVRLFAAPPSVDDPKSLDCQLANLGRVFDAASPNLENRFRAACHADYIP